VETTSVTRRTEKNIVRPLSILVPLIKGDLENGNRAGMPYYRAAGEKMLEARSQVSLSQLYHWTKLHFDLGRTQTHLYMSYSSTTFDPSATAFTSLADYQRRHLGRNRPSSGQVGRDWRKDVDDIAERARNEAARIREEELSRAEERKAEHTLALRIIDIGYKVLAKELHPDKGGSLGAMSRLNRVRDRLKAHS
jgi:hypothetical protein